jgi:hypothetical protein
MNTKKKEEEKGKAKEKTPNKKRGRSVRNKMANLMSMVFRG